MYKSHFHAITEIFVCPNVPMLLSNVRPWVPLKGMDKLDMSWTCPGLVPDKSLGCPKSSIFGTSEKGRVQLSLKEVEEALTNI